MAHSLALEDATCTIQKDPAKLWPLAVINETYKSLKSQVIEVLYHLDVIVSSSFEVLRAITVGGCSPFGLLEP